jgi:hypothetical protein
LFVWCSNCRHWFMSRIKWMEWGTSGRFKGSAGAASIQTGIGNRRVEKEFYEIRIELIGSRRKVRKTPGKEGEQRETK